MVGLHEICLPSKATPKFWFSHYLLELVDKLCLPSGRLSFYSIVEQERMVIILKVGMPSTISAQTG